MLLCASTTDKVQVITDAAVAVDVHASYMDYDGASTVTPGRKNTAITTATTTDVVLAPASGVVRNVKYLSVMNTDLSAQVTVTVRHTDGTTPIDLYDVILLAGEKLAFVHGDGFRVTDAQGRQKMVITSPELSVKTLLSDQSNSTITPTEVTGLTVGVGVGTYVFNYYIRYQAAALTTGVKFDVNMDGTVTSFVWNQYFVDVSATAATAAPSQNNVQAASAVTSAFSSRAKGTAGRGTTLSVDTINADMLTIIEGLMVVTVAGNLELWHGSEVAAASTVKAGTSLVLTKTG